ncbi:MULTISPECIES: DHH family phosphoesterase [unclassified Ruminococcus]|uniref:DHH family phosphoesterase n=1 Tax=unclassified Ruminococcus TaxID=2608920 RepID=UPI00210A9D5D|nr:MULTISPECIES: DHH family phosphoesterase [unclassified Ruminococcus]MCQ4022679.1 DHH family phosphoesterase [Ruminococcus sp. zg-924]MCQ4114919.1 DHH family phosphoesterase [Ruminococcus sp. zg-921]
MKKRSWTLTPFFLVFSVAIMLMAAFSYRWNIYIFAIEMSIAIVSIIVVFLTGKFFQSYIKAVVKSSAKSLKGVNVTYLDKFSIPVVVAGEKGDVVWYNKYFKKNICQGREAVGDFITQYTSGLSVERLVAADSSNVSYGERRYTVIANEISDGAVLYFIDDTNYKKMAQEYADTRPVIAILTFDNREEFERDYDDEQLAHAVVIVENTLQKWAMKNKAMYKKIEGSKYLVLMEERNYRDLLEDKFSILEEIKALSFPGGKEATVSIGVGRGSNGYRENEIQARKALEMALGRGGDQAAVKTGESYRFFGGGTSGYAKLDKVRARVIAGTLIDHIKACENVLIMGHANSDLDCIGAAVGIWSAVTKTQKKPAHIVVNQRQSVATQIIESMKSAGNSNMFMEPDEALMSASDKTLLIIVDTHSPTFLESVELYEKCKKIVVIDHHRMMVNHIDNSLVFFHEPFASSASEMATELIQYMGENILTRLEADALLAGIMLDTKNFVLKTGVRTFEAAAYLRQCGADTVEVKRLFSNSIDSYKTKYQIVSQSEIYNSCAIACADDLGGDVRVTAAQAADELLSLHDVVASFVLYQNGDEICISARSLGDMNVQLIMEQMGGGGHMTMAGAQIKNSKMSEAREKLVDIISKIDIKKVKEEER